MTTVGSSESWKERNIASGQQANHFPHVLLPSSYPRFLLQDSSTGQFPPGSPPPPPPTAVGAQVGSQRGPPWGLHTQQDSRASMPLQASQVLSGRFSVQGCPVSSPDLCWVPRDILAGDVWPLCSCLSPSLTLHPELAPHSCAPSKCSLWSSSASSLHPSLESPAGLSLACFVPG